MDVQFQLGQRIAIVGSSGSGKTTLAESIAHALQIPHVELDALHWEPNWTEAPDDVFRSRLAAALSGDCWVTDGNYSRWRSEIWSRADTIVWLDYPFFVVANRLIWRTLRRSLWQEELWSGNRESLQKAFFSRDSILLWMLQTYDKHRRQYPLLFAQPEFAHLNTVQLRSPQQADQLLKAIAQPAKNQS